jgi:hypothetical protein
MQAKQGPLLATEVVRARELVMIHDLRLTKLNRAHRATPN